MESPQRRPCVEKFVKGNIVVVPFPFSNLMQVKKRPALVIRDSFGQDVLLCQITSQTLVDSLAIPINVDDFESGTLNEESFVRINKLLIADQSIISYTIGSIKKTKMNEIIERVIKFIRDE